MTPGFDGIGRVLVVSCNARASDFVGEMIAGFYPETVVNVSDGDAVRRLFLDGCAFDYVFINLPLQSESGVGLATQIAEDAPDTLVMAMLRAELADTVGIRLSESGVFTLTKPVVRDSFVNCVRMMIAARSKLQAVQSEVDGLRQKIEEISYVSRAKIALVREQGLTESEAHRYIEKMAMDTRRKRREIAAEILDRYEQD